MPPQLDPMTLAIRFRFHTDSQTMRLPGLHCKSRELPHSVIAEKEDHKENICKKSFSFAMKSSNKLLLTALGSFYIFGMDKDQIAEVLVNIATLLELKGENPFKTRAYMKAARA